MTKEERAYNYASKCKATKFQVGEIAKFYNDGYEQAEKDLELTPEDIKLITKIHYEIVFKDTTGIKIGDVASEVLKRFKEVKQ